MTLQSQFDILWKACCREAIWELLQNKGCPLSQEQLWKLLEVVAHDGFVARALALFKILNRQYLTQPVTDTLVKKCIELGWIPDAIHAVRNGHPSREVTAQLVRVLLDKGYENNKRAAEGLLRRRHLR